MPGHKGKQGFLVTESRRLNGGVGGNAIQVEGGRRSEQIASGTLRDIGESEVQGLFRRFILLPLAGKARVTRVLEGLNNCRKLVTENAPEVQTNSDLERICS